MPEHRETGPALRLTGVRKDYKLYDSVSDQALDLLRLGWMRFWRPVRHRTFSALKGIDLTVARGERVGVIGRNGAGKTTMLKLITGNFAPTSGDIQINGRVQALMQTGLGFHGEFTGRQNVQAALVYNGLAGDELDEAVASILEFCELGDFLDQPVKSYSLGMRTRLQFATATAINPDIVIIDEVLGAGDAYFAKKSNDRIKALTAKGATLLIVSHSMAQILQFADRVVWLDQGRVVASGAPLDIVNQYEEFIYKIEANSAADSVDVGSWLAEAQGGGGSDWGGTGPLRIDRLRITNGAGEPCAVLAAGAPLRFTAAIRSDRPGTFACSCVFVLYADSGEVVSTVVGPERELRFGGDEEITITARLDDNPIGEGRYFLSAGLYRDFRHALPELAVRYHILSRACQLRIRARDRDPSRVLLRPAWSSASAAPTAEAPPRRADGPEDAADMKDGQR